MLQDGIAFSCHRHCYDVSIVAIPNRQRLSLYSKGIDGSRKSVQPYSRQSVLVGHRLVSRLVSPSCNGRSSRILTLMSCIDVCHLAFAQKNKSNEKDGPQLNRHFSHRTFRSSPCRRSKTNDNRPGDSELLEPVADGCSHDPDYRRHVYYRIDDVIRQL